MNNNATAKPNSRIPTLLESSFRALGISARAPLATIFQVRKQQFVALATMEKDCSKHLFQVQAILKKIENVPSTLPTYIDESKYTPYIQSLISNKHPLASQLETAYNMYITSLARKRKLDAEFEYGLSRDEIISIREFVESMDPSEAAKQNKVKDFILNEVANVPVNFAGWKTEWYEKFEISDEDRSYQYGYRPHPLTWATIFSRNPNFNLKELLEYLRMPIWPQARHIIRAFVLTK